MIAFAFPSSFAVWVVSTRLLPCSSGILLPSTLLCTTCRFASCPLPSRTCRFLRNAPIPVDMGVHRMAIRTCSPVLAALGTVRIFALYHPFAWCTLPRWLRHSFDLLTNPKQENSIFGVMTLQGSKNSVKVFDSQERLTCSVLPPQSSCSSSLPSPVSPLRRRRCGKPHSETPGK